MDTIEFSKLTELVNNKVDNFMVMVALQAPENEEQKDELISEMNEFFTEEEIFTNGLKVIDLYKVTKNVNGKKGQTNIVLKLSDSISNVNPIKRLQMSDLKWLEDFVANYADDYIA